MWQCKSFSQLSTLELFEIYRLRTAIFVVEQNCPYQEVDEYDLTALHLFAQPDQNIAAYCRIIPKPHSIHIGRVAVAADNRGSGLARDLMQQALQICQRDWAGQKICIQAQDYLQAFYRSLGFQAVSDVYLEDNIPHIDMEWQGYSE